MELTPEAIHKLFVGTFNTPIGKETLMYLKRVFVDRDVYKSGLSFEDTAYREGQRNVILQIIKEIDKIHKE